MTVEFELDDDDAAVLLRGFFTYGLNARMDGFEDEADEASRILQDMIDQAEGQFGGGSDGA